MLQLYGFLIVLFVGTLTCAFLFYAYSNAKYRKTEYYRITHRPFLRMIRSTGSYGEYLIYRHLRSLEKEGRFLFNVYLPKEDGTTTELDVLLIHSSGLYVFESKNYCGWIFGTESRRTWTQSLAAGRKSVKNHFYNPIMQNEGHISHLKQCLSDYAQIVCHSIILFSDRCELKKITLDQGKAAVMNRHQVKPFVKRTIAGTEVVLSHNDVESIYQILFPYSQTSEETKQTHIENIQAKYRPRPKKSVLSQNKRTVKQTATETAPSLDPDRSLAEESAPDHTQPEKDTRRTVPDEIKEDRQLNPVTESAPKEPLTEGEKICPRCGKPMVQRVARHGKHRGEHFLGCSGFPKCRYTEKEKAD
ncbi:NERD domain-containing protein [Sporolactobacillus sp. Y61]|uniref:NERD domain-containing protein n=1 Tax=Sporolactobacillus sp. Y61 TaxID=3160863 RepID=A0AAU8IFY3_9BACL